MIKTENVALLLLATVGGLHLLISLIEFIQWLWRSMK